MDLEQNRVSFMSTRQTSVFRVKPNAKNDMKEALPAVTVVFAISPTVVVLLVTCATTCAKSLNQLCLATSNRSARCLGSATRILRSRSRACGVTYSGKVRAVVVIYL